MPFRSVLCSALAMGLLLPAAPPPQREVIVCGWEEVYIVDLNMKRPSKVWSWQADEASRVPVQLHEQFRTTDECKAVDGAKNILITSSSDGVALVERASRKLLFFGSAGGAHSAEILPGGRIVVASSTSERPLNNSLVVFDRNQSGKPLFDTELKSGHGVVWDQKRQVLWALGGRVLRTYKLDSWNSEKPRLLLVDEYPLPDAGGHDLMAVPGTELLSLTTLRHAWMFDREKRTFTPHPHFPDHENVKSISVHPRTGEIAWTQADRSFWWTSTLRFLNPELRLERSGERLYKVRWAAVAE